MHNYVVALQVTFSEAHSNHIVVFAGTSVETSTDEGAVLEPHQVAVDCQELKRLHCLMGAMLGGSAPAASGAPTEAVPYTLPTVGRDELCAIRSSKQHTE